jgi:hypothetical protein
MKAARLALKMHHHRKDQLDEPCIIHNVITDEQS